MLSINTNLSSIITQNSMKQSTNKLNKAVERMTTGYKINQAKDNAANYSISTNMSTKISAYDVAADNVAMGMDMLTTASESMTQMENLGKRLHALNTQARNGTYGKQSLNAIQAEANSIIDEINRLYSTAKYNGISLFNQKEYDIPEGMPQADPVTGFIENPYDYTEEDLKNIESISKVTDSFTESEYKIETVADLAKLAKLTNDGVDTTGVTFVLANDLDLKEYCEEHKDEGGWTPIGNDANRFKGTFNGNGHIISNLTINRPSAAYQGLFGATDSPSKILNIGIEECNIIGHHKVGGLLGASIHTTVENSYSKGILKGSYSSTFGGLIGVSANSSIKNCYSESKIESIDSTTIGGLVGYVYGGTTIDSCFANVDIIKGNTLIGGLVGSSSAKRISNSYSLGSIEGVRAVGGLIGYQYARTGTEISDSMSFVEVKGTKYVGSFIGQVTEMELVTSSFFLQLENINNIKALSQGVPILGGVTYADHSLYDYDISDFEAKVEETQLHNINTNLQVGTKSNENSQIDFNTNFEYALGRIKRDGIQSEKALNVITEFLNTMSDKQTQLGAVQNRLESAMDEIITQHDNLVSARSTLRDADMAELSSQYIQQQILQEASATLMATTNQSPAIALQLI